VGQVIAKPVPLLYQDFVFPAVPAPRPVFIRPAKAKREVWFSAFPYVVHWTFKQPPATKPVVVVAKTIDPVLLGEIGLSRAGFRKPEIVESQVRRQMRLIMTLEELLRFDYVRPFRKTLAPPLIVFWNRMKLRQMESNGPHRCFM
jgi:hypothetical protein